MADDNVVNFPKDPIYTYVIIDSAGGAHLMNCASVSFDGPCIMFLSPDDGLLGAYYNPISVEMFTTSMMSMFKKEDS